MPKGPWRQREREREIKFRNNQTLECQTKQYCQHMCDYIALAIKGNKHISSQCVGKEVMDCWKATWSFITKFHSIIEHFFIQTSDHLIGYKHFRWQWNMIILFDMWFGIGGTRQNNYMCWLIKFMDNLFLMDSFQIINQREWSWILTADVLHNGLIMKQLKCHKHPYLFYLRSGLVGCAKHLQLIAKLFIPTVGLPQGEPWSQNHNITQKWITRDNSKVLFKQ